ncbi:MAG: MBL fold metallo-hydrolase [Alphaproteobacteria bacterium]|nr:MBL fold metallo-hydrolase [Alphaproteobacteria bacterium]
MMWARRIALSLLAIAVLAGAGFFIFRDRIAEAAFRRAAYENVGRDRAAQLPDGLHVYLCGTGSPLPDPGRAGPCLGVIAGERAFVFDVGSGSVRVLGRMGFPLARLERVYISHLHSDHIDGLGELMLQAWIGGARSTPLPIAGPQGIETVVAGFSDAYRIDSGYRIAHHGEAVANPAGFGGAADIIQPPGETPTLILDEGDLKIYAISVDHEPVSPAFGFRIEYKNRSIAISGDTAYSPRFVRGARDVDVMFHEALAPRLVAMLGDAARQNGQANLAKIMSDIPDYHTSPEDAARAAQEAGVDALVLYHLIPPLPSPMLYDTFLGDARQAYRGRIRIGRDGMLVSLPAGSDAVRVTRAVR